MQQFLKITRMVFQINDTSILGAIQVSLIEICNTFEALKDDVANKINNPSILGVFQTAKNCNTVFKSVLTPYKELCNVRIKYRKQPFLCFLENI